MLCKLHSNPTKKKKGLVVYMHIITLYIIQQARLDNAEHPPPIFTHKQSLGGAIMQFYMNYHGYS